MKTLLTAVATFALGCSTLAAQSLDGVLLGRITQRVEAEMEAQSLVGLSLAVGVDGELAWTRGFGFADLEHELPASEHTVYRLASLSKPITAVAVMQLVERGELDLDAPIRTYVPDWPEKRWKVTAGQLLGHQGGVRHYVESDPAQNTTSYSTATAALALFSADPLLFEPGTSYRYSSFGYNLLGAAVEGAAGVSYVEYLDEHVFPLAGTTALQADSPSRLIERRARGYRRVDGRVRNALLVDTSYKVPSGGLCGTAADLVRFAQALEAGRLVRRKTRDRIWTEQSTADGTGTGYGLGWFLGADRSGHRIARHGGAQTGAIASLIYFVDDEIVVSMLCNSEWCDPQPIVVPILKMLVEARR